MFLEEYKRWLAQNLEDKDLAPELAQIAENEEEIKDRFALDLAFGTAGLRGVIGAGTNRMNIYTVRKTTQGLANYLLKNSASPLVAVSYDSRNKSELFAKETAKVLAANGITAHIYPVLNPVPALSFAVRRLKAAAGVMVTASHNPAKYNGYKVYGNDGCQMTSDGANAVLAEIDKLDIFANIKTMDFDEAAAQGLISYIHDDVLEAFYENVKAQSIRPSLAETSRLKIVYSPLNGSGNVPVRRILKDIGFSDVVIVKEQELPDGNFPTCPYPNPEIRETLELGLNLAKKCSADLMLATDPDADRVGLAVRNETGGYHLLNGNEIAVLLLDYICKGRIDSGTMPKNPVMVKSIVTTPMADEIAKHYGVEPVNVLTGFKYIGEQILQLEQKGEIERFIFGCEESHGYLSGTYVRDKDAVAASMLICEMAAWYKTQNSSIYQELNALYAEYGRYLNHVDSFNFEGLAGMDTMANIMKNLRQNPPKDIAGYPVLSIADYDKLTLLDIASEKTTDIHLPPADVLNFILNGANVMVRPSGTEPKVKIYYTTKGATLENAQAIQQKLAAAMAPYMV